MEKYIYRHNVLSEIDKNGFYEIEAKSWKEETGKEPRLSFNRDSFEKMPEILRDNDLAILSMDRNHYRIGPYKKLFINLTPNGSPLKSLKAFNLKSLPLNEIKNEDQAISLAGASGIFQDFLSLPISEGLVHVNPGRFGANSFDFLLERNDGKEEKIHLGKNQIEVDGLFETKNFILIIEGKIRQKEVENTSESFGLKQLYFPYRHYEDKNLGKKILPIYLRYIPEKQEYDLRSLSILNKNSLRGAYFSKMARYKLQ